MGETGRINWNTGRLEAGDAVGEASVRIAVAGDWAGIRRFESLAAGESIYGDLVPVLRECDLRIVNLESPFTTAETPTWKDGPNLKSDPSNIAGLEVIPFDVACLANNHTMDFGAEGLSSTIELLDRAGIAHVGAGTSPRNAYASLSIQCKRLHIGIVNFCEGEDNTAAGEGGGVFGWDIPRAIHAVTELRSRVDFVLVIAHCGREYAPVPPPYIVHAYRSLVEAGADAIVGHHPHVPQGIELYQGRPIVYSLGNFVFDQPVTTYFRRTGYFVVFGIGSGGEVTLDLEPYRIGYENLRLLRGEERRSFLSDLERVSAVLGDITRIREVWNAFVDGVGVAGLEGAENRRINELEPGKRQWAALRNRFITPAHRELWIDATSRIIDGTIGDSPEWAKTLVDEWKNRPVEIDEVVK